MNMITIHKHTCDFCGEFGCTRPGCPLDASISHEQHQRELARRERHGFVGPDGRPS